MIILTAHCFIEINGGNLHTLATWKMLNCVLTVVKALKDTLEGGEF